MIYQIISWIGFGLAAIFLLIAIILFFSFDIISLHGEVSGKTAAKQMKEIREQNRKEANRRRVPIKNEYPVKEEAVSRTIPAAEDAVSYTHLDVYKRQVYGFCNRNNL